MPVPALTLPVNTNTTDSIDLGNTTLVGLFIPSGFTPGSVKLQTSLDGTNFMDVQDGAGSAYSVTVGTPPCFVPILQTRSLGVKILRLVGNTNQNTNAAVVTLATRNL